MGLGIQSSVRAKRLWNVLKATLILVARKGLISKRRFIMDMNLMVKRGKVFRKSVTNFIFTFHHHYHHHHHSSGRDVARGSLGVQDYEFSCSNTPINPVFSHISKHSTKYQTYFPCINLPVEMMETNQQQEEDLDPETKKAFTFLPMTPENTLNHLQYNASSYYTLSPAMERGSPLLSPSFNVRISNYSSEEENENISESGQVDNQAEEFIKTFYEQLKMQRRLQLLQYS